MDNYKGDIIEESLDNKEVLKKVKILSTRVEKVTEKHQTPWLKQWTLHFAEVPENHAKEIAQEISNSLDPKQKGSWYADFKNNSHHYIIFHNKIFYVKRNNKVELDGVRK